MLNFLDNNDLSPSRLWDRIIRDTSRMNKARPIDVGISWLCQVFRTWEYRRGSTPALSHSRTIYKASAMFAVTKTLVTSSYALQHSASLHCPQGREPELRSISHANSSKQHVDLSPHANSCAHVRPAVEIPVICT